MSDPSVRVVRVAAGGNLIERIKFLASGSPLEWTEFFQSRK